MIKDKYLVFADAQASTVSVASTDIVDTLASGYAIANAPWLVIGVDTAYTSASTPTNQCQLQTSDDSTFADSTSITLVQSTAFLASQLTAGAWWAVQVPPGSKRYLRVYKVLANNSASAYFTAGKFDAYLVDDIPVNFQKRYRLQ